MRRVKALPELELGSESGDAFVLPDFLVFLDFNGGAASAAICTILHIFAQE